MRRPTRLWAVTLALGLCSTAAPRTEGGTPVITDTRDPEILFAAWRWIGVLKRPNRVCPTPPAGPNNWTTQTLFAVEPPPEAPPEGEPALLHEFCVYETAAENPDSPFPNPSAFVRLDRDFMGVMPSGGALEAAYASELSLQFASQAGDVDLPLLANHPQVRVAIVDTAATREVGAENFRGTSAHGFTLLNLVKSLLCDAGGGCVAKVTSRLALGWKCFEGSKRDTSCRDAVDGGRYGLPTELATAIHLEVQAWRSLALEPRLVLNVSAGWDPIYGGLEPSDSDVPAPALAVRTALEHAACEGALVIAAAGNRTGGPTDEVGPLLPAAWELRAGPTVARCVALGVTPDSHNFPTPGQSPYRPLVFAAGGVRADGGPLFNSRTDAEPRLVAFGDHAKGLAPGAPGSGWTSALTGTSVSAAVVSAAAAAVWYYDRGLKPYDVPKTAYQGGTPLGRTAEFCGGGGAPCVPPPVKRISVCGAAVAAGGVATSSCPPLVTIDPSKVDLSGVAFMHKVVATDRVNTTSPIGTCQMERLSYKTALPVDPCPHWQYYPRGPQAKTKPQPGPEGICLVCTYEPELTMARIQIDSAFNGTVSGGILKCGDATLSLDLPQMKAGDTAEVTELVCAAEPIQLSFTVDGDNSVTSSFLEIDPQ